jgi:Na+/H+ antiporter NhaD/arsenite permease-like protein
VAATLIFLGTYLVLAMGRLPGLRLDRTGAAIIGAAMMIASGALTLEEAYRAINMDTLILLFGMMIVVANLRLSGFFGLVSRRAMEHAHRPLALLIAIVTVSGVMSAFFVNDTICLILTPLVIQIASALRRNPVPYLLAVAMAANAGSAATITGNPQNMLVGSFSAISYSRFAAALTPVALFALVVTVIVIAVVYREEFRAFGPVDTGHAAIRVNRPLMWKSLAISAAMVALFFWGWPVPKVAIVAGAVLLLTRRVKPEKIYHQVDWPLLVLFAGLFVVVAGMEKSGAERQLAQTVERLHLENTYVLSSITAVISNLVSNVPAVLIFKPFVAQMADPGRAWLTLAMSSTMAGNLTILGSIANLIVVERARSTVRIGFWEYAKTGIPVTVATLLAGAYWLS